LIYLKNFCFKDAVKVEQYIIKGEEDFDDLILERNLFSNFNSTFCLLQQITIDNDQKYFIFGIKFDDIYIPIPEEENLEENIKVFIYEKTFLFISNEPLCKLFEKIFYFIIHYKKLIFCNNLLDYNSLTNHETISKFNSLNEESVSE
jgi:hypothetical protein